MARYHHNIFITARNADDTPNADLAQEIFDWCGENLLDGEEVAGLELYAEQGVVTNIADWSVVEAGTYKVSDYDDIYKGFCKNSAMINCYDQGIFSRNMDIVENACRIPEEFGRGDNKITVQTSTYTANDGTIEMYQAWRWQDESGDIETNNAFEDEYPFLNVRVHGNAFLSNDDTEISAFPWGAEEPYEATLAHIVEEDGLEFVKDEAEEKYAVVLPRGKCQYDGVSNDSNKPIKIIKYNPDIETHEGYAALCDLWGGDVGDTGFTFMSDDEIENYAD